MDIRSTNRVNTS